MTKKSYSYRIRLWIGIAFGLGMVGLGCGGPAAETKVSRRSTSSGPADAANKNSDASSKRRDPAGAVPSSSKKDSTTSDPDSTHELHWTQPIQARLLGIDGTGKAEGKSLKHIITSEVAGRDDDQLCSACHNRQDAQGGYGLDVDKNASLANLDPWQKVGTKEQRTWAGKEGWVMRFIKNQTKPPFLKAAMSVWLKGGCKEDDEQETQRPVP